LVVEATPKVVTFVVTSGRGSMDLYSSRLAPLLPVPKLHTDIYENSGQRFGASFFSVVAVRSLYHDLQFIAQLRRRRGFIHLPNHHMGRYIPLVGGRRVIVTVHDLIRYFDLKDGGAYIHVPNLRDRFYLRLDYYGIRQAAHVIAVSELTKRDLVAHLGIPPERITVVHHGVDTSVFRPGQGPRPFPFPYVLFVGSEHPRKNLSTLLSAFASLKARGFLAELKLVKVGRAGGRESDFRQTTMQAIERNGLQQEVVIRDFVPQDELVALYQHAECLLFPSRYEGFGWPPLEAMACGTPVIASTAGSVPEVVGDAALLVEPDDIAGWARAMERLLTDGSLREELKGRGLERAGMFTWERAAQATLRVYDRLEGPAA